MNTTPIVELVPCDGQRILVADDEAPVRDIFRMLLASSFPACTIDVAANGIEAVQFFRQAHPVVVLMDLKMPLMDGSTAFQQICDICHEKGWAMPAVIFCSGFVPSHDIRKLAAFGQNYCLLQKPVSGEILLNAVKRYLPAA